MVIVEGSRVPRLALAMAREGITPWFLMMILIIHWKLKIQTYENDNSFNINFSSTCNGITHFLSSMDLVWSIGTNAMVGSTWIWLVNFLSAFPPNGNLPRYKSSSRSSCGEETTLRPRDGWSDLLEGIHDLDNIRVLGGYLVCVPTSRTKWPRNYLWWLPFPHGGPATLVGRQASTK